jgi:hypothetical protein
MLPCAREVEALPDDVRRQAGRQAPRPADSAEIADVRADVTMSG